MKNMEVGVKFVEGFVFYRDAMDVNVGASLFCRDAMHRVSTVNRISARSGGFAQVET
jgi:hypothetical protein